MELIEKVAPLLSDPVFVSLLLVAIGFILGWSWCLIYHAIGAVGEAIMDINWKLTHKKLTPEKEAP